MKFEIGKYYKFISRDYSLIGRVTKKNNQRERKIHVVKGINTRNNWEGVEYWQRDADFFVKIVLLNEEELLLEMLE